MLFELYNEKGSGRGRLGLPPGSGCAELKPASRSTVLGSSVGCTCMKPGNSKRASKLTTHSEDQHEGWAWPMVPTSVSALKSISLENFFLLSAISFQIAKEISLAAHTLLEGHVWLPPPLPPVMAKDFCCPHGQLPQGSTAHSLSLP